MQEKDMESILRKVEELKSVFALGARLVPFLEDLLQMVQEIAPMLDGMDKSVRESVSETPEADRQPDEAGAEAELAASGILERVDDMLSKLDGISGHIQRIGDRLEQEKQVVADITDCVEKLLKIEEVRSQLAGVFESDEAREVGMKIKTTVDGFLAGRLDDSFRGELDQLLQDVQSNAFDIRNSLQVQDVTSGQITGAHDILHTLQERLNGLIARHSDAGGAEEEGMLEEVREDLEVEDRELDEMSVDKLLNEDADTGEEALLTEEAPDAEPEEAGEAAVADEIDALFEDDAGQEQPEEPVEAEEAVTGVEPVGEEEKADLVANQDEIDALFDSAEQEHVEFDESGEVANKDQIVEEEEAAPASEAEIDELLDWGDIPQDEQPAEAAEAESPAGEEAALDDLVAGEETAQEAEPEEAAAEPDAEEMESSAGEEAALDDLVAGEETAQEAEPEEAAAEPEAEEVESSAGEEATLDDLMAEEEPAAEETAEEPAAEEEEPAAEETAEEPAAEEEAAAEETAEEPAAEEEAAAEETAEEPAAEEEEPAAEEKKPKKKGRKSASEDKADDGGETDSDESISQEEIDKLFG